MPQLWAQRFFAISDIFSKLIFPSHGPFTSLHHTMMLRLWRRTRVFCFWEACLLIRNKHEALQELTKNCFSWHTTGPTALRRATSISLLLANCLRWCWVSSTFLWLRNLDCRRTYASSHLNIFKLIRTPFSVHARHLAFRLQGFAKYNL